MVYNICAILIGLILLFNLYHIIKNKNDSKAMLILCGVCGLGLLASGIAGFFIPKELEYITIILLLFFAVLYILVVIILKKKAKSAQE